MQQALVLLLQLPGFAFNSLYLLGQVLYFLLFRFGMQVFQFAFQAVAALAAALDNIFQVLDALLFHFCQFGGLGGIGIEMIPVLLPGVHALLRGFQGRRG